MGRSNEGGKICDSFSRAIIESEWFFLILSNEIAEEEDDEVEGDGEKTDADHSETNLTATATSTRRTSENKTSLDEETKIEDKGDSQQCYDADEIFIIMCFYVFFVAAVCIFFSVTWAVLQAACTSV